MRAPPTRAGSRLGNALTPRRIALLQREKGIHVLQEVEGAHQLSSRSDLCADLGRSQKDHPSNAPNAAGQHGGQQQQGQWQGGQGQSPYPPAQQHQQNQGAWNNNQSPYPQTGHQQPASGGGGGYGSHDGLATVSRAALCSLPFELLCLLAPPSPLPARRTRLTLPLPSHPFSTSRRPHFRHLGLTTSSLRYSTSDPRFSPLPDIFYHLPRFLRPLDRPPPRLSLNSDGWFSLNPQNQDMANAQNSEYVNLRNQAIREGDLMVRPRQTASSPANADSRATGQGVLGQQDRVQLR